MFPISDSGKPVPVNKALVLRHFLDLPAGLSKTRP